MKGMKWLKTISPLLTLILIGGVVFVATYSEQKARAAEIEGRVAWVTDGDTIRIEGHPYPIRLWGIDAAERDTIAGQSARSFLESKIKGERLLCRRKAVDDYRRTVATCEIAGEDLSALMINVGHAQEFCRFSRNAFGTC